MTKLAVPAVVALILSGCAFDRVHSGPTVHENKVVELGKSEMARIELKMAVGELHLEGGSSKLMEADFFYNVPEWKPVISTNSSSFRQDIKIEQPEGTHTAGDTENKWDIRFNSETPVDLVSRLGVGETRMNLGGTRLRSLRVEMGVGSLNLDLRGALKTDCDVEIHGGVGEATVLVPKTAGISATATGGIGEISMEGLEKRENRWVNPARDPASPSIHLEIAGGVGNIRVVAE